MPTTIDDHEIIRKDGTVRYHENSICLLTNEAGDPIGFFGIARDNTERKKAESALRESEEKYRLVVENASEAIYITQNGIIKFPNPKTELLTGLPTSKLEDLPFADLIYPADKEAFIERQAKQSSGESAPVAFSFRIKRGENEVLWVELNAVQITWEGRPAVLNFLRDITPQKKMEAQLLQAQKMEAIGTLAGGIAHDFNNLLMGVQGNVYLMLMDIDTSHSHYERLKSIEQLAQAGADLTKQLLGVAMNGKYEVKATDTNQLVETSLDLFGRTRKEISIHQKLQKDVWPVEVDRSQMGQTLLNLYVNAWQAMPNGGDLFIETQNVTLDEYYVKSYGISAGQFVRISVTDNGIGMDETIRKRVFDPFFTTKEMGKGTGLGLASAYGIVRNHGGIINVYSEKGEGSTFNIYIPVSGKAIALDTKPRVDVVTGNGTLLLVDDEDVVREVGRQILERLGYRVITAVNGDEAVEIFRKNQDEIDMVILDMILPKMNGGEVYEKLKVVDPRVKVLLSSGYSVNGQAKKILDRGCNGFIQKPFTVGNLSKMVWGILQGEN